MPEPAQDKIALDNTKECLSSLSKMTYLLMSMLIALFYVIVSRTQTATDNPDVDLVVIKIKAAYLPLIVFPALYGILMHASRCLSIIDILLRRSGPFGCISDNAMKRMKTLVMTHEWPFNPFVDFLVKWPSKTEIADYREQERAGRFRVYIAYFPFLATFILAITYVTLVNNLAILHKLVLISAVTEALWQIFKIFNERTSSIISALHTVDVNNRTTIYNSAVSRLKSVCGLITLLLALYLCTGFTYINTLIRSLCPPCVCCIADVPTSKGSFAPRRSPLLAAR